MSTNLDQKTRDWIDFANLLESQGLTLNDVKRKVYSQPKSNTAQSQTAQPQVTDPDDLAGDLIKMQRQMAKAAMFQNMMKQYGLLVPTPNQEQH